MDASELIDKQIAELGDWRGKMMGKLRALINESSPELKEEWKWGNAVWTAKGNACGLGAFKDHVKVVFFKGAHLEDPQGLFNGGLDAKESRAIDLRQSDTINEAGLKAFILAAIDYNRAKK